jgi:predicted DNA-binding protein YlxM (UPF0122 family)
MKLIELAEELKVSAEAIKQFIQDFDLELVDCISTNFEVKEDFEKFARENVDFLRLYEKDLDKNKTLEQIAEVINQPKDKVEKAIKTTILIFLIMVFSNLPFQVMGSITNWEETISLSITILGTKPACSKEIL